MRALLLLLPSIAVLAPLLLIAPLVLVVPLVGSAQPFLVDSNLQVEEWATGLDRPVAIDFLGPGDALVLERFAARVRRVTNGVVGAAVLELPGGATGDETLLGIAINTESPAGVFLYVEDRTGLLGNRIERYDWNPTTEVLENPQLVFQVSPAGSATLHDGGYLLLGPPDDPASPPPVGDGQLLYVTIGDLERSGQLQNTPAGSPPDGTSVILRLLQDGSPAPGNPFTPYCSTTTTTTCSADVDCPGGERCVVEVESYYAYGVRNSYGLAIDPATGSLWDTENGPDVHDELNRVTPGMNSGWIPLMGPGDPQSVNLFDMPGAGSTYRNPELSWLLNTGPTGVVLPHSSALGPAYDDHVLFGDFNQPGQIYALPLLPDRSGPDFSAFPLLQDKVADTQLELDALVLGSNFTGSVVALERGPDDALYVVTYFDGRVYRLSALPPGVPSFARWTLALCAGLLCVGALWGLNRGAAARSRPHPR